MSSERYKVSNTERYERLLNAVWLKQARMSAKSFATDLSTREQDYIQSLPRFCRETSVTYPLPMLVERKLPFVKVAEKIGVKVNKRLQGSFENYLRADLPRSVWINDQFKGLHDAGPCTPTKARESLKEGERTLDPMEALSYFMFYPERVGLASVYVLIPEGNFQLKVVNKEPKFFKTGNNAHYMNSALVVTPINSY